MLVQRKKAKGFTMTAISPPASYYEPTEIGHYAECDNGAGFYCEPCNQYISDGAKSRNWCDSCGKFAPRPSVCICALITRDMD
jgi:hypothetical protein